MVGSPLKPKILVIEDAADIQLIVGQCLKSIYQLKSSTTAAHGWEMLTQDRHDLILLDIGLPDEDGFQLLTRIRTLEQYRHTPVIVLTGKGEATDKVRGFSLGADDYLVKPFEPLELQARVATRLRKHGEMSEAEITKGQFTINLAKQKIFVDLPNNRQDLGLTTIEFKLLHYFLRYENQLISRQKIMSEVWGDATNVSDRSVDSHIYNLRQKMGDLGHWIRSVPRAGYRFAQLNQKTG